MDNNKQLLHRTGMWRGLFTTLCSYRDYLRVTLKLFAHAFYTIIEQFEAMIPEGHLSRKCHVFKILNVT